MSWRRASRRGGGFGLVFVERAEAALDPWSKLAVFGEQSLREHEALATGEPYLLACAQGLASFAFATSGLQGNYLHCQGVEGWNQQVGLLRKARRLDRLARVESI